MDGFSAMKLRSCYLQNPLEGGDKRFKTLLTQNDRESLLPSSSRKTCPPSARFGSRRTFKFFADRLDRLGDDLLPVCRGLSKLVLIDISLSREQDNPQPSRRPSIPAVVWARRATFRITAASCPGPAMLSYGYLANGAAVSAVLEVLLMVSVPRWRKPWLIFTCAIVGFCGPFAWQVVLKVTESSRFYTDLPVSFFPISWQDLGSGVATFALRVLTLAYGPMRTASARAVVNLSLAVGAVALLVDIYYY